MSPDEFEQRLRAQPLRTVPPEWRGEMLAAARKASGATRVTPRRVSPLSAMLDSLFSRLWPHPAAWAGLAAVWVLMLSLHFAVPAKPAGLARRAAPVSPQVFMAFREQRRLLAELLHTREIPVAVPPRAATSRPRSQWRGLGQLCA